MLLPETRECGPDELLDLYGREPAYCRGGMLASADGAIAFGGVSAPLQTPGDGRVFAVLRAVADVVLVGAGTARQETYGPVVLSARSLAWRAARGRPAVPLALVSRSLELDPAACWFPRAPRSMVLTCAAAPRAARARLEEVAEVLVVGEEQVDLGAGLRALAGRGFARVLCEGGPQLLGDLVRAGLLTELCATVSPLLAGGAAGMLAGQLRAPVPLELAHLLHDGEAMFARWRVPT